MNFGSSALGVDLHEKSNSYLMIHNNNSRRVTRRWSHGVDGNQGGVDTAVSATSRRSCKMTEKGKQYQLAMLGVERQKLASKLTKKMSTIESMLCSVRNSTAFQKELNQVDDLFKLIEGITEGMKAVDGGSMWTISGLSG